MKTNPHPGSHSGLRGFFNSQWVIALVLSAIALSLYSASNRFKFYYHPDESGKVRQIIRGKRNFNHPLLLLTTARLLAFKVRAAAISPQRAVLAGRMASAIFATATVVALALLARRMAGSLAGWSVGFASLCNPQLFELAHYMKEDPALAMGLAFSFLGLYACRARKDASGVLLAGAACGFAVSGKYLGLLILPFAFVLILVPVWQSGSPSRRARFFYFLLGLALTCAVLNYPIFSHPGTLVQSFSRETHVAVGGHKGLTRDVPHAYYLEAYLQDTPWIVTILMAVFFLRLLCFPRKASAIDWTLIGFSALYVLILSFSPKTSRRYFLPASTMVYFFAGMGAAMLAHGSAALLKPTFAKRIVVGMVWVACIAFMVMGVYGPISTKLASFGRDDHEALAAWVRANLPVDNVIAQDDRVNLPHEGRWEYDGEKPMPQKILNSEFVADLGTLHELQGKGVTHVAVCAPTYLRFFVVFRPTEQARNDFDRRKDFYQQLFDKGTSVWASPAGAISYTQPGITLYDIRKIP